MRKRALVSVSDKTGVVELCRFLSSKNVELVSTGGTGKALSDAGIPYLPIEEITGNPEAFGGRMKTLSFHIEAALLYREDNPSDQEQAKLLGIKRIHYLICNLYPFDRTVRSSDELSEWIENIDVGGPTMLRAGAKNHAAVAVLSHPRQYQSVMDELRSNDTLSDDMKASLAVEAFQLTAGYDLRVASALTKRLASNLRYGENPHQGAVLLPLHNTSTPHTLARSAKLQGKELSYNNWLDADQAFKLCSEIHADLGCSGEKSTAVIVKHGTPCGVALHRDPLKALQLAIDADPMSAFGGIVSVSFEVSLEVAKLLTTIFFELIVAPSFSEDALQELSKKKNLRLLRCPMKAPDSGEWTVRSIHGGLLIQDEDELISSQFESVTRKPFGTERTDLVRFGLHVTKHLKSNCIGVYGENESGGLVTLVTGVGQPNRLECITKLIQPRIVENKINVSDGVLISDAFFPFPDSIEACAKLGIRYIVQPGGSIKDSEVISACDRHGIAMVFTKMRHFRH